MIKILNSIKLLYLVIVLIPTISYATSVSIYHGYDIGRQHVKFKSGYGDGLFKKNLTKVNIFAGIKLTDCVGVEGGYETTFKAKKDARVTHNNLYFGKTSGLPDDILGLASGETGYLHTKIKIYGFHLGLFGNYNIWQENNHFLDLTGGIIAKKCKINLSSNFYKIDTIYGVNTPELFNNKKIIPKISIGINYFAGQHFGIKTFVGWEKNSAIKLHYQFNADNLLQAKIYNSLVYGCGLVFKI
jgi:hypothetical protein